MAGTNEGTGLRTRAIHAGEAPDPATGASAPNLAMSSTFVQRDAGGFSAHDAAGSPYVYARWQNPTVAGLEAKIAALEGTEAAAAYASGMAAVAAVFLTELSAGDHLVVSEVCYAGVTELVRETLPRFGIAVSRVDTADPAAVRAAVRAETRLIHVETPANPLLRLTDLAAVAAIAKAAGVRLSCDATFGSPVATRAADYGVDYTIQSLTKYVCGHGDALGGSVAGRAALIEGLRREATVHQGGALSPFNAWLIARGAATLPLRMAAHEAGAAEVARWLEAHPRVERVFWPGLASHPQHGLARAQMRNFSGMIAFRAGRAAEGRALAQRMAEELRTVHYAVSLGHHRSLIFWIGTDDVMESTFRLEGAALARWREAAGDGVFRLSVGLEDPGDIIADLARVLG